LTSDFIASGYDTKHLMRTIVNSQAYQLSSDYDPNVWNLNWQPLFARKMVRRLWSEEVADSISLSSSIANKFTFDNGTTSVWALQYPEPARETLRPSGRLPAWQSRRSSRVSRMERSSRRSG